MFPDDINIDHTHTAILLIEILFEKGLINKETYINVKKKYQLHISQTS